MDQSNLEEYIIHIFNNNINKSLLGFINKNNYSVKTNLIVIINNSLLLKDIFTEEQYNNIEYILKRLINGEC